MQGEATIEERLGVIWLHLERVVEARQRVVVAPEFMQGKASIRERLGIVGPLLERPVEACDRRFFFSQQCLNQSKKVKRIKDILAGGNDLLAQLLGLNELPRLVC